MPLKKNHRRNQQIFLKISISCDPLCHQNEIYERKKHHVNERNQENL